MAIEKTFNEKDENLPEGGELNMVEKNIKKPYDPNNKDNVIFKKPLPQIIDELGEMHRMVEEAKDDAEISEDRAASNADAAGYSADRADTAAKRAEKVAKNHKRRGWRLPLSILGAGVLVGGASILARAGAEAPKFENNNQITLATPKANEAAGTPNMTITITVPAVPAVPTFPVVLADNRGRSRHDETSRRNDDRGSSRHDETSKTIEVVGIWADTASEAAARFGTDSYSRNPDNWEPTAESKGWHMKEDGSRHNLNLEGFVGQGYWDTLPGKNAQSVVANGGTINVQGATIWNVQGERAAQVLWNQTGINSWSDGTVHSPLAQGFTPDSSVGFNQ
jgi:hypothetical protein